MNKIYIVVLCFALTALVSCSENIFGSSDNASCGNDVKCLRLQAENQFRDGNYEKAYNTYSKIVSIDSTASVGYFGMAKAGLWKRGVNPFDMLRFSDLAKLEDGKIPFVDDSISIQNRYYQGSKLAYEPLNELHRRDSLTVLYEAHKKDSLGQRVDVSDSLLNSFRDQYQNSYDRFPLSDREYKYNAYYGSLVAFKFAKTMLGIIDENNDSCITKNPRYGGELGVDYPADTSDEKAWQAWGCVRNARGQFEYDSSMPLNPDGTINTGLIFEEMQETFQDFYSEQLNSTDPTEIPMKIENINDKIDNFNGDLKEIIGMLGGDGGDPDNDWQAEISKYSDYASFYKMGTRLDEDGDGCIDEELLNGQDNDGDDIMGEDARLASLDISNPIWGKIGSNHVMMYNEDPNDPRNLPMILSPDAEKYICNEPTPDCPNKARLLPDEEGNITVIGFTQEPGYWTTDSLELKLEVAQDTECGNLKYGLEKRKELVGGCWLFYNEEQFKRIWLNRHANNCCFTNPNCAAEKIQIAPQKKIKKGS